MALESIEQAALKDLRREHSRKPDDVRYRIEALYPNCSRIELFARHAKPDWDVWGNQVTSSTEAVVLNSNMET